MHLNQNLIFRAGYKCLSSLNTHRYYLLIRTSQVIQGVISSQSISVIWTWAKSSLRSGERPNKWTQEPAPLICLSILLIQRQELLFGRLSEDCNFTEHVPASSQNNINTCDFAQNSRLSSDIKIFSSNTICSLQSAWCDRAKGNICKTIVIRLSTCEHRLD